MLSPVRQSGLVSKRDGPWFSDPLPCRVNKQLTSSYMFQQRLCSEVLCSKDAGQFSEVGVGGHPS